MLHCHVSTVALTGQNKQWFSRGPFVFLAVTLGVNETREVQFVAISNLNSRLLAQSPMMYMWLCRPVINPSNHFL